MNRRFFIFLLLVIENLKKLAYHWIIAVSIFILASCSDEQKGLVDRKDSQQTARFIREFFIDGQAIYTLIGEKPVTMETLLYYGEEEHLAVQQFLETHQELNVIQEERFIEEDWPIWKEQIASRITKKYLFAEIHPKHLGEKESLLLFLNIPATLQCLEKNYEIFSKKLAQEFHSKKMIKDLIAGRYDFWNKIFEDHQLTGILLGFGVKNAELFQLAVSKRCEKGCKELIPFQPPPADLGKRIEEQMLYLPAFACMDSKESEIILNQYSLLRDDVLMQCKKESIEQFVIRNLFQK